MRVEEPATHEVQFSGSILRRAFWLYVYEVETPEQQVLLYVGRTGDSSSVNAQSAYRRLGQHLLPGEKSTTNQVWKRLKERNIDPVECEFRFVSHGPLFEETADQEGHDVTKRLVGASEDQLVADLLEAGYEVLNKARSLAELDEELHSRVRDAFAPYFPGLVATE